MKYTVFLSDGAEQSAIDFSFMLNLFNGEKVNKDTFKTPDGFYTVVNVNSHTVSNYIADDIYVMPSVANSVDFKLIQEKIDILRKGI